SPDGRWVTFLTNATNLVPTPTGGRYHCYRHDRLTGFTDLVSASAAGAPANGDVYNVGCIVSDDGQTAFFDDDDPLLVSGDVNGAADVLANGPSRTPTGAELAADLTGDDQLDDTVLSTIDLSTGALTGICPAGAVAVAAGAAAFLRPENAGPTPSLPL